MIKIQGLTQEQVEMCDNLWSIDNVYDVEDYIAELPTKEQKKLARTMHNMIIAAVIDDEITSYDDCFLARNMLDKVRR